MIGTPTPTFIRAIPKGTGWVNIPGGSPAPSEMFFDLTNVPWKDQQDIRKELDNLGFYVQDIFFSDPMPIQVGLEIRNRIAKEQESSK